ncbi:hypothetical protein K458DRAFT_408543 [Lentithecium fluviatile CBS 122367]|uniref:Uncharacterized protein n=1 Tax=Lentithecium fluviatile CBS 122367 TaxID=1168545 RepID=A0A6G1ILH7_9PLEO|nr:hypothetical protein K458DRAFT_408543 [Lentithecium fluviatile CBS 122367]
MVIALQKALIILSSATPVPGDHCTSSSYNVGKPPRHASREESFRQYSRHLQLEKLSSLALSSPVRAAGCRIESLRHSDPAANEVEEAIQAQMTWLATGLLYLLVTCEAGNYYPSESTQR